MTSEDLAAPIVSAMSQARRIENVPAVTARLHDPFETDETFWRAWRALEEIATPNPFYASFALRTAIEHLPEFRTNAVQLLTVSDERGLVTALPVTCRTRLRGLPVQHFRAFRYVHSFYDQPLIRLDAARDGADLFVHALASLPHPPVFIEFQQLCANGPFAAGALGAREAAIEPVFERACLYTPTDAEDYLAGAIRKKKRKELARLRNRLAEMGDVKADRLDDGADIATAAQWIDNFLALEHSGWKAEGETSLRADPDGERFFRTALIRAHEAGALDFRRLRVGDRTIAMIVNFISGDEGFSVKIAHDPAFARFSPGVLLEIELTRAVAGMGRVKLFDSCAAPDHPMINAIWRERRSITAMKIASATTGGRLFLKAYRQARKNALKQPVADE